MNPMIRGLTALALTMGVLQMVGCAGNSTSAQVTSLKNVPIPLPTPIQSGNDFNWLRGGGG
jgi:hypothetical protein